MLKMDDYPKSHWTRAYMEYVQWKNRPWYIKALEWIRETFYV